ncbi:MAG: shikimate kinase [Ardenticatenaceae bacterium]|nr:shikimate kinase [Ardenticatenaceae bacterium]
MDSSSQKKNIILTGFMGTGKTTVARLLAARLNYAFVDTDVRIEAQYGRSIPQIFAEWGEAAFRQMERETAQALAAERGLVIATGGRMMLDPANVAVLGGNGRIYCLTASPETILARVMRDGVVERPLLAVPNPRQRILDLLTERREKYAQFRQIPTDNCTPQEVAQNILNLLDKETGD